MRAPEISSSAPVSFGSLRGRWFTLRGPALADFAARRDPHSTQFRSEAAIVLTTFGASPGDRDLIVFLRERGADHAE